MLCAEGLSTLPRFRSAITLLVLVLAIQGARGEVFNEVIAIKTPVRQSPLGLAPPKLRTADPETALVFSSKCGYVSAAVDGLFQGPAYLLKSSDDAWVLKCIAGSEIEADKESLRRFRKIVLVNQGCPPVPARTATCRDDALTDLGFARSAIWNGGSVCEFEKSAASAHN